MPEKSAMAALYRRTKKLNRRAKKRRNRIASYAAAIALLNCAATAERQKRENDLPLQLKELALQQKNEADFLHFDNAALVFPSSERADVVNMYRVSALMKAPVQPLLLQRALNLMVPRFPSFVSAVKRGFFWFYLEPSNKPLVIQEQNDFPCRKIPIDARHALIRVTYYHCEISVEIFHSASDANGGLVFFNSLIACYLKLCGVEIKDRAHYRNHLDRPKPEELEDSYQRYWKKDAVRKVKGVKAYSIPGRKLPYTVLILTKGITSGSELNSAASKLGLTVGQLVAACYIYAVQENRSFSGGKDARPIELTVPVDLRRLFKSETLRNFISFMTISQSGAASFEEICQNVKRQFSEQYEKENFQGIFNFNVSSQHNPFLKFLPLPLKVIGLKIANKIFNDDLTTTLFSNLGVVRAPEEFKDHVVRYEFTQGFQSYAGISLSAVCYNDTTVLTFSRTIKESNIEKYFFRKLASLGVEAVIETNFQL